MPPNKPLPETVKDVERLLDWYQLRLRADRHLSDLTVRRYRHEIARLEALRTHLRKRTT
jgi:hypothetical protein